MIVGIQLPLTMTPKQIAQRWFEELWNNHDPAVIAELMDPSSSGVTEGGPIKGPAEFRAAVYDPLIAAFPDFKVKIEGTVAEQDEVVVRWTANATHRGQMAQLSATGKRVRFSGMTWLRFRGGKIVEGSDSYNLHGLMAFLSTGLESASVRRG